jgi:hypothetical protein
MTRIPHAARLAFALCFALATLSARSDSASAAPWPDKFHDQVDRAAKLSNLTVPGTPPFHLKLTTKDTSTEADPALAAEVEIWWKAPDTWRRSIKSPGFTQLAIRNGEKYYESSGPQDFLPLWLDTIVAVATDPVPAQALAGIAADEDHPGCGNWEVQHGTGDEIFSSYASVCFNNDGTMSRYSVTPASREIGVYTQFAGKRVPQIFRAFPGGRAEVTATLTAIEPLDSPDVTSSTDLRTLFDTPRDTGYAARLRFMTAPGAELVPADSPVRAAIDWPASFIFPMRGVIAAEVTIDREGNLRDIQSIISKNQGLHDRLRAQMKNWKFKPYLVDGAPVEVLTTLEIPFQLKFQPLGANGKVFPEISFGERIKQFHAAQNLRAPGRPSFRMEADFTLTAGATGKYSEQWVSPEDWVRTISVDGGTLIEKRVRGAEQFEVRGNNRWQAEMHTISLAMQVRLPDLRTFQEQDWGNSAVPVSNADPTAPADTSEPVLIRPARGSVSELNHPTSGQAYWFDGDGLLVAEFVDGVTAVNSQFESAKGVNTPRKVVIYAGASKIAVLTVKSIQSD